jgi:hypothetical protein
MVTKVASTVATTPAPPALWLNPYTTADNARPAAGTTHLIARGKR